MFQWILPTGSSPPTTTRPCSRKLFLVRLKVYHSFRLRSYYRFLNLSRIVKESRGLYLSAHHILYADIICIIYYIYQNARTIGSLGTAHDFRFLIVFIIESRDITKGSNGRREKEGGRGRERERERKKEQEKGRKRITTISALLLSTRSSWLLDRDVTI